jgi:hypothetical protein
MAMSKGAKIALGCAVAFIGTAMVVTVVLFGVAWWGVGKARQFGERIAGDQQKIEKLHQQANRNAFTPPADGVLQEDRLVRFLNVRKKVYRIYAAHKEELDRAAREKPQGGLEDLKSLGTLATLYGELRLAQAEGLAEQGMSDDEYKYMIGVVYKTLWSAGVKNSTGQSATEVVSAGAREAARQAEEAASQAGLSEEARRALRDGAERMRDQADKTGAVMGDDDVRPENVELLKKYRTDVETYAMVGIEALGI